MRLPWLFFSLHSSLGLQVEASGIGACALGHVALPQTSASMQDIEAVSQTTENFMVWAVLEQTVCFLSAPGHNVPNG